MLKTEQKLPKISRAFKRRIVNKGGLKTRQFIYTSVPSGVGFAIYRTDLNGENRTKVVVG